ncbi:hypothetical protein AVEN_124775-1 [Araneus ventricosus]|uniref:Uncharacterized protein n=1 Tax=Araneus ventricosus TaxID=182803 RepID=A0A4Y2LMF0_ARAVE|nr:hypothetical protein AVEN_124775-1 [Araneus ventricosus]
MRAAVYLLRGRGLPDSKSVSTKDPSCIVPAKSYVRRKSSSRWCEEFVERVPAQVQVSSSSSDRGSKLRDPSQNSPLVASKWDINETKPFDMRMTRLSTRNDGGKWMGLEICCFYIYSSFAYYYHFTTVIACIKSHIASMNKRIPYETFMLRH